MKKILFLVSLTTLFVAGCSSQFKAAQQSCNLNSVDVESYLCASRNVLTRMDFKIDKFDLEKGYLRTLPLRGAQLFEFWRKDNVGSFNTAESNLHSITRTVEICSDSQSGCFESRVYIKRLWLKSQEIDSISQAGTKFTKSSSSQQKLILDMDTDDACWIDLGRDCKLEQKINCLICKELGRSCK